MALTDIWNAAFKASPANGDNASSGDDEIRTVKRAVEERLVQDHSWAGDADDGLHKKATLIEQASDPAFVANRGFVFTKDVNGITELFYMDDAGKVKQITTDGKLSVGVGNAGQLLVTNSIGTAGDLWVPRNYTEGLVLSKGSDSSNDINITIGDCADSTNNYILKLTAALTKQIDVAWAAGTNNGGMFTGTVANDITYYVHLIRKDSDGTIDVGFDTSLTPANIPTGYTAYRKIGSLYRNALSANTNIAYNLDAITETGEWVPIIADDDLILTDGVYLYRFGSWVKIGKEVLIRGAIKLTALTGLTGGDSAYIGNIPFTPVNTASNFGSLTVGYAAGLAITATETISGLIQPNLDFILLEKWSATVGTQALTISELSATGELVFSGHYTAA